MRVKNESVFSHSGDISVAAAPSPAGPPCAASRLTLFVCYRVSEAVLDRVDLRVSRVVLGSEDRRYSTAQYY